MFHCQPKTTIAQYIIGSIDESGYLQRTAKEIVNDLLFNMRMLTTQEKVQKIIKEVIHALDPPGVGALTLQECLLLQLERMEDTKYILMARKIIKSYFDEFSKKHYEKIIQRLRCTQSEFDEILAILLKLDPKRAIYRTIFKRSFLCCPSFIVTHNDKDGSLHLILPIIIYLS